ncbi:MAG: hypothetical protein RI897_3596 [Verrucomicrobiota bacterium]
MCCGGWDIDDIVASGEDADVFEVGELLDRGLVEYDLIGEKDGGLGGAFEEFVRLGAVVDLAGSERAEGVPGEVAGVERVAVEDGDGVLHGGVRTC